MDRWAANTLRALGIIFTAGFVLITSLLLVLLSMCAAQGAPVGAKRPDQAIGFAIAAVLVAILGITLIARLARDIFRSGATPSLPWPSQAALPHPHSRLQHRSRSIFLPAAAETSTTSSLQ